MVYLKTAVMREKWCVPRIHSLQMSAVVRGISIKVENLKHLKDLICLIQRIPLLCFSGNSLQVLFTDNDACGLLMKRRARADCVTWTIYGYTAELRFMAVNVIAHVVSYFASTADQRYVTSPNCRQ